MILVVGVATMAAGIFGCQEYAKEPWDETTIMLPGNMPLVLAHIPAGTFMMGRHKDDQDTDDNEYPQHQVTIVQDFYMGKYEIMQQQWLAVMDSWPDDKYLPNADRGVDNSYPAYFVSCGIMREI